MSGENGTAPVVPAQPAVKPGIKSTEFAMNALIAVFCTIAYIKGDMSANAALAYIVGSNVAYTGTRALAKAKR